MHTLIVFRSFQLVPCSASVISKLFLLLIAFKFILKLYDIKNIIYVFCVHTGYIFHRIHCCSFTMSNWATIACIKGSIHKLQCRFHLQAITTCIFMFTTPCNFPKITTLKSHSGTTLNISTTGNSTGKVFFSLIRTELVELENTTRTQIHTHIHVHIYLHHSLSTQSNVNMHIYWKTSVCMSTCS